jgi:hypothetical protein
MRNVLLRTSVSEWHKRFKEALRKCECKNHVWKQCWLHFFDIESIIHHEFVPEKKTVNGKFYKKLIKTLIAQVHCVRPGFQESVSWYFLRNNAPAYSSGGVSKFFGETRDPRFIPSTVLPWFGADFFFIFQIKNCDERDEIRGFSSIQQATTRELRRHGKKRFLGNSFRCMSDVNIVRKRGGGTIYTNHFSYFLIIVFSS